jgi:parallel beta-helix repeat protein
MKALSSVLALGAVASLAFAAASSAASCPDKAPTAITAPGSDAGRACQNAIAKAALGFVKSQLKTEAKCMSAQKPGACPNDKDTAKIQKAAIKAQDQVVKACGGGALAGLTSSYSAVADPLDVASCTLSQNNVEGRLIAFKVNGTPGVLRSEKSRDKCVKTLNSAGVKYALSVQQSINKCLASQIKAGAGGNLSAVCIGQYSGGVFTPPSDVKTSEALAKNVTKLEASIAKACDSVNAFNRESIFACPGATSTADLQNCIACGTWDSTLDILAAQYSETGTLVTEGADALQNAVDAAAPNAKLLIQSGLYQEDVSITDDSLHGGTKFSGCGGASGDRPKIQPPTVGGPFLNGVFAAGVNGLVFQSLEVSGGWDENGIFVTGANGVAFRDLVTDGGDGTPACVGGDNDGSACTVPADCTNGVCTDSVSTYGIFPVESSNVLVELSSAENIRDAGIYVGSCFDYTVRYNTAVRNVAGIEIENSTNATVYGNYATGNVGGLLVFKLPGPTVQRGNLHDIFANVIVDNNVGPNFGIPNTTVAGIPPGTGIVVMSIKDTDFHHNIVSNNNSYGFAVVDQQAFDTLAGGAFGGQYSHTCDAPDAPYQKCNPANAAVDCPLSASCSQDQKMTGNAVYANLLSDNASDPSPGALFPAAVLYAVFEEDPGGNNNCFSNNANTLPGVFAPLGNIYSTTCP